MDFNGTRSKWQRVSRRWPCPVCGKPDWCLFAGPADAPTAAICCRIESQKCVGSEGAGWLHRLRDDDGWRDRPRQRWVTIEAPATPAIDFAAMAAECYRALGDGRRASLANDLGVTAQSLGRLAVGWSAGHRSYTFPMRADVAADAPTEHGYICGIRLRRPDSSKWAVRGSRQGLFVASDFPVGESLIVCEGATDTAAMLSLSLDAVGRASCTGGAGGVIDLVLRHHFADVAIVADADPPGQRGARSLAARLVGYVPDGVRIVTPPSDIKDAREWVRQGATRLDVLDSIEAAPVLELRVVAQGVAR